MNGVLEIVLLAACAVGLLWMQRFVFRDETRRSNRLTRWVQRRNPPKDDRTGSHGQQ